MFIIRLAREIEACQYFIEVLGIINNQVITFSLTGEKSVHSLRIKPFFAQGFAFHLVEARVELSLQLGPFFSVGIFCAPRETIKLVNVEVCQNNLEWHVLDNSHAKLRRRQG